VSGSTNTRSGSVTSTAATMRSVTDSSSTSSGAKTLYCASSRNLLASGLRSSISTPSRSNPSAAAFSWMSPAGSSKATNRQSSPASTPAVR
jgi:hypothetical protein